MSNSYPLFFILGPTAVGKSDLALNLALKFQGAVVNFDSLQFYKDINIGTAKPSCSERKKCPHFLFDICEVGTHFTAGQFRKNALTLIDEKESEYPLFFVGGSGFYLQALEKGMYSVKPIPETISRKTQKELEEFGIEFLYKELVERDPAYAIKIGSKDKYRIQRATNLIRANNKPISEIMNEHKNQLAKTKLNKEYYKIGLFIDREKLRQRVKERTLKMLTSGWIEETQELLTLVGDDWAPLKSVGYKELVIFLKNQMSYDEMVDKIITNTMRLAKRQMTWFKKEGNIHWFDALENVEKISDFVASKIFKKQA
ncbi:MAG: tRNA (adenosine(37)-N6)-dimethylallyltransferase MiaA [Bdellovibrionaceae bacterium]|nr:tRNA (adenosine(37)-N6)-dimethylallyltransferase MiaA [Pseudobdellovibrionaceae bacterium]